MRILLAIIALIVTSADTEAGCRGGRGFGRRVHCHSQQQACGQSYNYAPQQHCHYSPQHYGQPVRNLMAAPVRLFTGGGCSGGSCSGGSCR